MNKNFFYIILISILSFVSSENFFRNVMYYGDWSIYGGQNYFTLDKIDGSLITHLNFAFLDVDPSGDLITTDTNADYLTTKAGFNLTYGNKFAGVLGGFLLLRNKYSNIKIGISVGGWTRSGDFPKVASSESTRKKFAQNCAEFIHYYGYDFVDIDWEYPTADREPTQGGNIDKGCKGSSADTENFTLLLKELREELDKYGENDGKYYELSVALSASPKYIKAIQFEKVIKIVDFANMMTYDFVGAWNSYTGHHTALYTNPSFDKETQLDGAYSVDSTIKYLQDNYGEKIDYSKIIIGVAPNTKSWKEVDHNSGKDKDNPGLYAKAVGESGVTVSYGSIDTVIFQYNLKKYWDDIAKANYFYSESSGYFYSCDTEESAKEKAKYVKKNELGGLITWMASYDPKGTVTQTIKNVLFENEKIPEQKIKLTSLEKAEVSIEAVDDVYTITLFNNNKMTREEASGIKDISIMPWAEKFGKTFSFPGLIIKTEDDETLKGITSDTGIVTKDNDIFIVSPPEWSSKTLFPGDSIIFKIKSGRGKANKKSIKNILMTQKIFYNGDVISSIIVYKN